MAPSLPGPERIRSSSARQLILSGAAPEAMQISGHLSLSKEETLTRLPDGLQVQSLDVSHCPRLADLPTGLTVRHLNLNGCMAIIQLPASLRCEHLQAQGTSIRSLPPDLHVSHKLDLQNCRDLVALPDFLKLDTLVLRGCTALATLPAHLDVGFLDLAGCTALTDWPDHGRIRLNRLSLQGCVRLRELPEGMRVSGWIDVAQAGITSLPDSLRGVGLRWRDVVIDERIAFRPETITVEETLGERNAERRRVMVERVGYTAFFQKADAQVLDCDRDAGGERRLLRVPMMGDEDLVCVLVLCPSTGRQYLLRVPPWMTTCHQAVAWMAGFTDPAQYNPLIET